MQNAYLFICWEGQFNSHDVLAPITEQVAFTVMKHEISAVYQKFREISKLMSYYYCNGLLSY